MKTAPNRLISDGWFLVVIKETPSWPASHVLRMASYIWGGCEKSLYIVHCTFEEAAKSCSRSPELVTLSSGDLKPNPRRELSCMNWFYSSTRHCQPALMEWTGIALWQEVGKVRVWEVFSVDPEQLSGAFEGQASFWSCSANGETATFIGKEVCVIAASRFEWAS